MAFGRGSSAGSIFRLRPVPGLMNWLSRHVIMPWERAVASVCYLFRTSIAEVLYIVLLSVAIFYVANVLRRLVTQPTGAGLCTASS